MYNCLNHITRITDPGNGVTLFRYDPNGNLLTVTDANNNTTTYTYDVQDRLETRTDRLLRVESYIYDLNGNLKTFTSRKGQVTAFTYDPLNRRIQTRYADGSQTGLSTIRSAGLTVWMKPCRPSTSAMTIWIA